MNMNRSMFPKRKPKRWVLQMRTSPGHRWDYLAGGRNPPNIWAVETPNAKRFQSRRKAESHAIVLKMTDARFVSLEIRAVPLEPWWI